MEAESQLVETLCVCLSVLTGTSLQALYVASWPPLNLTYEPMAFLNACES